MNTGLEAPWRHSYYAPPSQDTPDSLESQEESLEESLEESSEISEEGSGSKETKGHLEFNRITYLEIRNLRCYSRDFQRGE